jgi:hypothetical protein
MKKLFSVAILVLAVFMLAGCSSSKQETLAKDNLYKAFEYLLDYEGLYLEVESVKYISATGTVEGETNQSVFYYVTYKLEGFPTRYFIEVIIDIVEGDDDIYHFDYDTQEELDQEYDDMLEMFKEMKTDYEEYKIKYANGSLSSSEIDKAYNKAK